MSANRVHNALSPGYRLHWYEIESVLGQGGFGITYLATDTNLAQSVAIKEFLPTDLAVRTRDSEVHPVSDARRDTFGWGLTRFLTEARTLAQFRHPNIVRVYSVFEANGTAYMVMEYERGTSLEDALKFRRLEGETALVTLVHAVMDGLELVHQAGFIHRDIKPDNIFMRAGDGVPVLLDFGSARQAVGVATKTLTSLVTPGYAPFEQYNATRENDRQGPWTDIYSLAATLYRGVTGAGPIDAVARADALLSGERDPLLTLAQIKPAGFSPQLIEAVDRGLAFQSGDRPQTLGEWRAMLPARPTSPDFATVLRPLPNDAARSAPTVDQDEDTVIRGPTTREEAAPAQDTVAAALGGRELALSAGVSASTNRGRVRAGVIALGVLAVVAAGAWTAWQQGGFGDRPSERDSARPATTPGQAPPAATVAPEKSDATPATVRESPAAPAPDVAQARPAALDAAREQLERERAALQAERQRLELRAEQQAVERARQEHREQARLLDEQLEQVRREREGLEALRAATAPQASAPQTVQSAPAAPPATPAPVLPPVLPPAVPARDSPAAVSTQAAAQQARIDALLADAQADEAALRLTSPQGNNALQRYREVLSLDAGNARALRGLASIVSRYLALAEQASAAGQFDRGIEYLSRARSVDANDARIEQLNGDLARAQEQQRAEQREEQRRQEQQAQQGIAATAAPEQALRAREREAKAAAAEQARAQALAEEQRAAQVAADARAQEQAQAQAEAQRTVNIGIFPNETLRSCYVPVGPRIEATARKMAAADGRVSLRYSYYAPGADGAGLGNGASVWSASATHKEPIVAVVRAAANRVNVDAVLMGWYHCHDSPNINDDTYKVWVYLVDVRTGTVREREAALYDTAGAVRALLLELYAVRGL